MLHPKQPHLGMRPLEKTDRIQFLKIGTVEGLDPGRNGVVVQFDGHETAASPTDVEGEAENTKRVLCQVGSGFAHFTSGQVGLPTIGSWVLVGFIENQEHAPVVLCAVHDDLTNILPTLGGDVNKRLWHHFSDVTTVVREDGTMEFVHPTGIKGFIGVEGVASFSQHIRQIRNDDNRAPKGSTISEEAKAKGFKEQQYQSPPDKTWDTGEWNYGPQKSTREPTEYDHRMVEQPRTPHFRLEHPVTGSDWLDDPAGSGGEFGANYQATETYVDWNAKGDWKFYTNKNLFLNLDSENEIAKLHAGETDYFLHLDKANEVVKLNADDTDHFLKLDADGEVVELSAKSGTIFLKLDGGGTKVTLQGAAGVNLLEIDVASGIAKLFSPTQVLIGTAAAQPLWKAPIADLLFNAHVHLDFLGIPTTPPTVPVIPLDGHLTLIAYGT